MYTMDREEIPFVAGVRCYPGQAAPYEVPANLTWNAEAGYATLGELPYVYDPNSGWLMDPETLAYHDANYGYLYDAAQRQPARRGNGQALRHVVRPHRRINAEWEERIDK